MCQAASAYYSGVYVSRVTRFRDAVATRPALPPPHEWHLTANTELAVTWHAGKRVWTITFSHGGRGVYILQNEGNYVTFNFMTAAETIEALETIYEQLDA